MLWGFGWIAGLCAAQNIQSLPAPFSAFGVTAGPDGALWLTPNVSSPNYSVGRMTTAGVFTQFSPPGGYFPGGPIATGSDGALWLQIFTANNTASDTAIARMTTSGISTVYAFAETDAVFGMTLGPDGAIWLAEGDRVGRIDTSGSYSHFSVGNYYPVAICAGADGNLWFLALGASFNSVIGRITPAGVSTIFPCTGAISLGVTPIALGPDGAVWFNIDANPGSTLPAIGRISTTGVISTFNIPNTSAYDFTEGSIAASPDGGMWFTGNGAIGRITMSGAATVYPLPSSSFSTYAGGVGLGLAAGQDGAMWFATFGNKAIGRVTLTAAGTPIITQISPDTIPVNSPATALKIIGSGLAGSSSSPCSAPAQSVTWNTTPLTISSAAAGEIDVTVPPNLLTSAGTSTLTVSVHQVNGSSCATLTATGMVQVTGPLKAATATQLSATPNPAVAGQAVTLTAMVSPAAATGTVVFSDGGTSLGNATLSQGTATLSSKFAFGNHPLTATYQGDTTYASSVSAAVNLRVNATVGATSISLAAVPSSQTSGNPVTLTATVTPATATGTVTFLDGTTSVGTAQLSGGMATLAISTLAVGSHTLSASYAGDAVDAASNSAPVSVTITSSNVPSILAGGIVNAASFAIANGVGAPVSPGSLVAIFTSPLAAQAAIFSTASLPFSLGGASVTFNNIQAPMVQVVPGGAYPFISAQVPFEVLAAGQTSATVPVVITVNNVPSAPVMCQIVASQPGIFTLTANGQGYPVLVNLADYSIAAPVGTASFSHPIPRGQTAFFYVTGLGELTPSVVDGTGTCTASDGLCHAIPTPTVSVGGVPASVGFAGQAPGFPGVMQINITIPLTAPTGDTVTLTVTSADGTVTSNAATISVQ